MGLPKEPLPPGVKALNVSNKQMEKYALKTGPGRKDVVPYKSFNKEEMLDEVLKLGFYSAWNDIKADVQAYDGVEMLLVADPDEKFGENWFICLTEAAKEALFFEAKAAERALEEAKAAAEEAERKRVEEELAIERIVVTEQPVFSRPYRSATSEASEGAVRAGAELLRPSRAPLSVRVQRRRYTFGAKVTFHDREADALVCDYRPRRDPAWDATPRIKEAVAAVQAGSSTFSGHVDRVAQTNVGAPTNYGVQCAMDLDFDPATAGRAPTLQIDKLDAAIGDVASTAMAAAAAAATAPVHMTATAAAAAATAFAALGGGEDDGTIPLSNVELSRLLAEAAAQAAQLESGSNEPVARGGGGGGGRKDHRSKDSALSRLVEFTHRVLPLCEHCLSQNETLNIYRNVVGSEGVDDGHGTGDGKTLREERQFMDLELSQHKGLPAVEWHPSHGSWLAVAAAPRLTLEARVAESGMPRVSHVLIYTLGEFVSQIVLECPSDVTCMSWNGSNPNLVVIGCMSGQVCLFDMAAANAALAAASSSKKASSGDGSEGAGAGAATPSEAKAPRVQPRCISSIEASHSRPVVHVHWLPQTHHITSRGVFGDDKDGTFPSQFLSVAGDGMVAVWDIRFRERELAKQGAKSGGGGAKSKSKGKGAGAAAEHSEGPEMLESALVPGAVAVAAPPPEVAWAPVYRVLLRLGLQPFAVVVVSRPLVSAPADPLLLSSEGGLLAAVDWAPVGEGTHREVWARMEESASGAGAAAGAKDDDDAAPVSGSGGGGGGGGSRMLWVSSEADRPAVVLHRHPSVAGVFLVVQDFSFSIWRAGTAQALFSTAPSAAAYTLAHWSPTRPAVLFLGRADGVIDAWDLLDSTAKPVLSFALVSVPLTSAAFRTKYVTAAGQKDKQLLAVGDSKGSLHILAVPMSLRRGPASEAQQLAAFLDREQQRAAYGNVRGALQDAEKARKVAKAAAAAAQKEALQQKLDAELQATKAQLMERKESLAAAKLDFEGLELRKYNILRAAAEVVFQQLQSSVMAELGVKEDDIAPLAVHSASGTVTSASSATATPSDSRKVSLSPADAKVAEKAAAIAAGAKGGRGSKPGTPAVTKR